MKTSLCLLAIFLPTIAIQADELDRYVRVIEWAAPSYPPFDPALAGYEKEEGVVSVTFQVDASGNAKIERIMNSSSWRFRAAACAAAEKWKFVAGKRDGRPSGGLIQFVFFFAPGKEVKVVGPLNEQ